MILLTRLVAQQHARIRVREAHTFQEKTLTSHGSKIPDSKHGILEVVDEPEADNNVELPQAADVRTLDITAAKGDFWKSYPSFFDIFLS
ncbi:MAG TPA: hypothetical protein VNB49_16230, partial [Candidatus Dormibacteraeota bacterium]|nr:hypothetical protein [Candidatus Dormibacteraeota bacterium]